MKRYQIPLEVDERALLASLLNRALGFSNPKDATSVVERIRALVSGGEWPERILTRLNGPAVAPPASDVEMLSAEPAPSRATLAILSPRVVHPPKATPARVPQREDLTCVPCGEQFTRIRTRGRKPTRCPACR